MGQITSLTGSLHWIMQGIDANCEELKMICFLSALPVAKRSLYSQLLAFLTMM